MTKDHPSESDRLQELLADYVTQGLDSTELNELERLLAVNGPEEKEAFERVAAAIDLSLQTDTSQALPADVAARLRSNAEQHLPRPVASAPGFGRKLPRRLLSGRETLAWLTAAACLLLALWAWYPSPVKSRLKPTFAQQREQLLREGDDVVTIPWTATEDPAARDAGGDVVWSNHAQRGFMRFRGLDRNDPGKSQYQLWIFDADRNEKYPIDGGVFDVDPATGDVIVPITPKLRVSKPTLFAVTVEKPGGVVVSTRERLPLLAKVPPTG